MQTTNEGTNDLSNEDIAPITPSPKRKRYNNCGSIVRGSRKRTNQKRRKQDERKVTDGSASVSQPPPTPLPIHFQVPPLYPPSALSDPSNIVNVNEHSPTVS
jgi:hypothetical protein